MSNCCSSSGSSCQPPKKYQCPVNGNEYPGVKLSTVLYHINKPWLFETKEQTYYFCDDPDCDVVYFGQDESVITQSHLRTKVGVKEKLKNSLVCYCFGVTVQDALTDPDARTFVVQQTKQHTCACETHNPSGRCCLKHFPKSQ